MKTKRSPFKKIIPISFLVLLMVSMQNCVVDVPPEDVDPPEFFFRITGDGFDHVFDQNANYGSITLMLREDVTYNFSYTGLDSGGLDRIDWQALHQGRIEIEPNLTGNWEFSDTGDFGLLEWYGDPNNPLSGSAVAGSFTTTNVPGNDATFRFTATDYGGETGRANRISEDLRVYVGVHNTRIRDY